MKKILFLLTCLLFSGIQIQAMEKTLQEDEKKLIEEEGEMSIRHRRDNSGIQSDNDLINYSHRNLKEMLNLSKPTVNIITDEFDFSTIPFDFSAIPHDAIVYFTNYGFKIKKKDGSQTQIFFKNKNQNSRDIKKNNIIIQQFQKALQQRKFKEILKILNGHNVPKKIKDLLTTQLMDFLVHQADGASHKKQIENLIELLKNN